MPRPEQKPPSQRRSAMMKEFNSIVEPQFHEFIIQKIVDLQIENEDLLEKINELSKK